ncbi:transcription initiation factor TFIID subunit 8 isoform X4 [Apodemus sylvaticus]|nr:transcription initiation factor TFIID subunit 8 isoform X4 [Apodemus sylvaticus]
MLQSYISEIGRSAKSYCEHTARTQPTLSDIVVTLVEMGFNVDTLPAYAKRSQRMVITAPPVTNQPVTPKALTAGQNRPHPPHIPSHFPEFPDPHTYIKTPTYREPVSDYQVLREKAASQRRDVERALTRFMAKTGETQSLFKDDVSTFPLIAARPFTIPYLTALLPSELEIQQMEETDSSEQDEQTDTENIALHISTSQPPPRSHRGGQRWQPWKTVLPSFREAVLVLGTVSFLTPLLFCFIPAFAQRTILELRRRTLLCCSRAPPCPAAGMGRTASSITPICGL